MVDRYCLVLLALLCFISQAILLSSKYFFLAPTVPLAIPVLFCICRFPQVGLLFLVFIIPFEGLFAENRLFTGAKLIGFTLVAVGAVKVFLRQIPLANLKTPLNLPLFFLLFFFLVSSVYSQYSGLSLQPVRQLLTVLSIFYIFLLTCDRLDLLYLARTIVVSVASTAVITLVTDNASSSPERAIGLLADPNFFALLLISALPLALYLVFHESPRLFRLFWGLLFVAMLIAFQKTMSRSGLLILLSAFFLLGINYWYVFKRLSLSQLCVGITAIMVLAIFSVGILPTEYRQRIVSLSSISSGVHAYEDRSMSRRSSYIVVGLEVFKKQPMLGSGPGTFPLQYAQSGYATAYSPENDNSEIYRRAHNTYLETLVETGLLGLLALLAVLITGSRQFHKARRHEIGKGNKKKSHLITHFGVSFIAIVMFFLFLSALSNKYLWIYLAVGCSLATRIPRVDDSSSQ